MRDDTPTMRLTIRVVRRRRESRAGGKAGGQGRRKEVGRGGATI